MEKVSIRKELTSIKEHWSQKIIGEANGQVFKLAKGIGSTNWHEHDDQDEFFILYKGHLTIQLRDGILNYIKMKCSSFRKGLNTAPSPKRKLNF